MLPFSKAPRTARTAGLVQRGSYLLGLLCFILGSAQAGHSAPPTRTPVEKHATVSCTGTAAAFDVTSERLTFVNTTRQFIFEGNVHIQRCTMSITCDRLQVRRHEQENTIEEMIATGHVHFQDGTRHATAERADYIEAEHKLVLTGQPRAWDTQENNELNGEEIVLFVQEEKMVVKRARMRFHPDNVSSKVP